jgi:two-component system, sensor histidine kinase RegB
MSRVPIEDELTSSLALPWILRLRYGLAFTELAILLGAAYRLNANVPIGAGLLVVVATILSNALQTHLRALFKVAFEKLVAGLFCFDILCLTAIFHMTGGASNPFSLLYLVQITLSATILSKRLTWFMGVLSAGCFGSLFFFYVPIPALEQHHISGTKNLHLLGMWVGFAVADFLIALFSGKISEVLRQRERQLLDLQRRLADKERLASLATLAAGAAHELCTPLATIAVVAKELECNARKSDPHGSVAEDSQLIRSEVERCRYILQGMSAQGAELPGELPVEVTDRELLSELKARLTPAISQRLVIESDDSGWNAELPLQSLVQALSALLKNAADAADQGSIHLKLSSSIDQLRFAVVDHGMGMSPEVLKRVGEPFFTTKPTGKGLGLGMFLVKALAEHWGGSLKFESTEGNGTRATLVLPVTRKLHAAAF